MSTTNDILIRGDAAAQARPIDIFKTIQTGDFGAAAGPWADEVEEARATATRAGFEQGHNEGLTAGMEQGQREMAETMEIEMEAELSAMRSALETALAEIERKTARTGQELAAQTTELALEIAEAVLARELRTTEDPGAEAIMRCLDLTPANGELVVRMHPDDAANLGAVEGLGDRSMTVVADADLDRGDAVVTVDEATIDARLSESLRRVGEALL